MISPASFLKSATVCAALLVSTAWITPASAQECKSERITVTGPDKIAFRKKTQLEGGGSAMRVAIAAWEQEVAAKVGEEWNQWDLARDRDENCENTKEGVIANRVACTISARPCRASEEAEGKNGERDVTRDADRPRKSDRFRYTEGRRGRYRDRDRDRDSDRDWDREREQKRYRWGAYDYDGRYTGYGPQYYRGYGHRHHDGYHRRRYYGGGYDHYPRTWIPRHLCGEAQLLLHECGYGVAPDSYCGYRTSRAIARFQGRHGLSPSGYPNERTMMALINVCGRR